MADPIDSATGEPPQIIKPADFTPRSGDEGKKRLRAKPLQIGLALVLLLFAAGMLFLFTARSVLFTFDPAYTELEIEGGHTRYVRGSHRRAAHCGRCTVTRMIGGRNA